MVSHQEVARAFARGADDGRGTNLAIVRDNDGDKTHLVAYGWAIYATRFDDENGRVEVYEAAWREWARERGGQATHGQFAEIRKGLSVAFNARDDEHPSYHALCDYVDDERPTWAAPPASVDKIGTPPER